MAACSARVRSEASMLIRWSQNDSHFEPLRGSAASSRAARAAGPRPANGRILGYPPGAFRAKNGPPHLSGVSF